MELASKIMLGVNLFLGLIFLAAEEWRLACIMMGGVALQGAFLCFGRGGEG